MTGKSPIPSSLKRTRGGLAKGSFAIRKAIVRDVGRIQNLVNEFASRGLMLGLSLSEVYEHLRDFSIAEKNGEVVGACALHIVWEDLAEIRSLVVEPAFRDLGIGRALVESCIEEGRSLKLNRVFGPDLPGGFLSPPGF